MTKWVEFPLRPQGQPWPGLNTRGGLLDTARGFNEDPSINAIINEADLLQKRKGLIRGLDERFSGVVCGLFRYTDECGIEYVIVADQDGIQVRQPFNIPSFLGTDSLPNDDFAGPLDTARWNNAADYETFLSALQLKTNAPTGITNGVVDLDRLMVWFKDSVLTSYQVEIQYAMVAGSTGQVIAVGIKGSTTGLLVTNLVLTPIGYSFNMQFVDVFTGVRTTLDSAALGGEALAEGFLRLSYDATTRTVSARAIPAGGAQVTLSKVITEVQDTALGEESSIGIAREAEAQVQIENVTGSGV